MKIKLGKILELERKLGESKKDFEDYKNNIQQQLSLISTNINTIGNLQNTINISIPGENQLIKSKESLDEESGEEIVREAGQIRDEIFLEEEDTIMALVKTRILLEKILRKILGKKQYSDIRKRRPVKYLGLYKLFMIFIETHPQFKSLKDPFMYVNQVCNAAAHAQVVSSGQSIEALEIGSRLIAILNDFDKKTTKK